MAGDFNGDGNVNGNDTALLAPALGSQAGGSDYSLALDINGDGQIDQQDQVILASNYGFHASTATVPTTPPTRPTFALDASSATADGTTTGAFVSLVGWTDPNITVTLQPTGATTTSGPNGLFAFLDVPVNLGANTFTAIATNTAGISSQFTAVITRTQPGKSLTPPVISAQLTNDTGVASLDNITSDDTISGSITAVNPIASFLAQIDGFTTADILASLSGTTFTLMPSIMTTIAGGPLADGKHTLTLLAKDSNGKLSQPFTFSFILETTAPAPVTPQLLASSDTGISNSDGITRDTTPTFKVDAPDGAIVRLYSDGNPVGQVTATIGPVFIATTTLAPGVHLITATVENVAGNVSDAAAPVSINVQTTPPATPTLGLDAASQASPGQTTETTKDVVDLTGTTASGAFVALYRAFDPNTPILQTRADANGLFTFSNLPLAPGTQAFTVIASDVAGNRSQTTQPITTTSTDTPAPTITAGLSNDTGTSSTDGITSDPTIAAIVDTPIGVTGLQATLDGGQPLDITSMLNGVGLTLSGSDLATINGGTTLPDGPHTLSLRATDPFGRTSTATVPFDLETERPMPPTDLHLIAADLTGTSQTITKARSLTVELTATTGTLVTLYMNGISIGQLTAPGSGVLDFDVPGTLADGHYLFTAQAGTVSGLTSPFSAPFNVTVTNAPPAITSFGLDPGFEARPYGNNLTVLPTVRLIGQTIPDTTVTLVETGVRPPRMRRATSPFTR